MDTVPVEQTITVGEATELLDDPNCSPENLIQIFDLFGEQFIPKIIAHPNASNRIFEILIDESSNEYFIPIVHASNQNPELMYLMLCSPKCDSIIASFFSSHFELDKECFYLLLNHKYYYIRQSVVQNPLIDPEILVELTNNIDRYSDSNIAEALTYNPVSPAAVMETLYLHDNMNVRSGVAAHSNTPSWVLPILLKDVQKNVRVEAFQALKKTVEYKDWPDEWLEQHFHIIVEKSYFGVSNIVISTESETV